MPTITDNAYAALVAAGYGPGSFSDMEYKRLLFEQKLVQPQSLTINDLYSLNGEKPRFPGIGKGLPEVRKNILNNPDQVTTIFHSPNYGTGGGGTITPVVDGTAPSGRAVQLDWTGGNTGTITGGIYQVSPNGTAYPGKWFGSMWVWCNKSQRVNLLTYGYDINTIPQDAITSPPTVIPANTWVELSAEFELTAPSVSKILLGCYATGGAGGSLWVPGDIFKVSKMHVEASARVRPAFSGATAKDANYEYTWTGGANTSPSIATLTR